MSRPTVRIVILFSLITLVSACGPAATPVPPTATIVALLPTAVPPTVTPTGVPPTEVQPTATSVPTMTPAVSPPTATPVPTMTPTASPTDLPPLSGSGGGVIAFSSIREGTIGADIFVMNTDGSDLQQLTRASGDDFPLDWSPDGERLLFMSNGEGHFEIYVMNADGSSQQQLTSGNRNNMFAAWSPDGTQIAFQSGNANGSDFEIYIMNADGTGQRQLTDSAANSCNPDWSPDGSQIAFDSDRDGGNGIYGMNADGSNVQRLTANLPTGGVDPAWSPDGKQIVFSGDDTRLYMTDADGSNVISLRIGSGDGFSPAWSPDGKQIAFYSYRPGPYRAGKPSAIYVVDIEGNSLRQITELATTSSTPAWRPANGAPVSSPPTNTPTPGAISVDTAGQVELLRTLEGHDNRLYGLAFSPDGRFFGSSSLDGVVQLWDPASWQVIREFTASRVWGWRLFFLADNAHISSGNGTVWNIASGALAHTLSGDYLVTFSPDGVWMAANGRGQFTIELWRVEDWHLEREIVTSHAGNIFALAFSPDSTLLATVANVGPDGPEFSVKLWDVMTGQELFTLLGHQDALHGLAFSPDGKWLATASMDTTVKIWDAQTGQLLHTLQNAAELFDVTFSPDSSLVASALNNKTVELWDVAQGRLVRTLKHGGEVASVAFSPDGTLLASGAYDSKIYLWGIP